MNSSIYECKVMHYRNHHIERRFSYNYFMFFLDIDEIDSIAKKLKFFSRNKFNVFNFRDSDHFVYDNTNVKNNVIAYLKTKNINTENLKIKILTNVATFGYNFNPVSFYFCYDNEKPICVVPEVGNTFMEQKMFFLDESNFTGSKFYLKEKKYFYVSPFIQHDTDFEFNLYPPTDKLQININDYLEDKLIFNATLTGKKVELNNMNLLKYTLKYPLVTLKVIGAIHWQALKLYSKKIRLFRKNEFPEFQKGMVSKWKK